MLDTRGVSEGEIAQLHRTRRSSLFAMRFGTSIVGRGAPRGLDRTGLTLCLTLSSESGLSTEKPIKMTCALEYARGRNRS